MSSVTPSRHLACKNSRRIKQTVASPSVCQSSSAPIKDLPLDSRFISPTIQEIYHTIISKEILLPIIIFYYTSLRDVGYDLEAVFRPLGMSDFLGHRDNIYEDLVREFYANLDEVKSPTEWGIVLRTKVCGKRISVSENLLCNLVNISTDGVVPTDFSLVEEHVDDSDDDIYEQVVL